MKTVELVSITKRFPGVLACDNVSLDVCAGEIHALLGENGAGKSTLMRVLYGLYSPESGQILLDGQPIVLRSPNEAIAHGIGMVHQHFMLVPTLTVTENVVLGLPSARAPFVDIASAEKRIAELSRAYGLKVDPRAYVWQLAVGEQQRVEIIKALYRKAAVLIMDEPTAVLVPQEVDELFVTLRQMARDGHAIVFISHKLNEVMAISDCVTVMRDGRVVGQTATKDTDQKELARMMVGRDVVTVWDKPQTAADQVMLKVENLSALGDKGVPALRGVTLSVRSGEILGVAGVSGNGQRELAEVITGLRPCTGGKVSVAGRDVTCASSDQVIAAGLAFVPEERMTMGVVRDFSVAENMILKAHARPPLSRRMFLDFNAIAAETAQLVREYEIKTPSAETPVKNLSGGNIQKLILARELARSPKVLVAAQPTRGVDIGATEYIHERLIVQRNAGTAILLISEDLDEVTALSDRIAVMYEGQIVGIVPPDTPVEELGLMMTGAKRDKVTSGAA